MAKLIKIGLLALFVVLPGILGAETLEPFSAEFRIHISRIPTPVTAELALTPTENNDEYQLEFSVNSWLVRNREASTFTWRDCEPRTSVYQHEFRGFGRRRSHEMIFSWDPPHVSTTSSQRRRDDEVKTYEIDKETLDDLTMLLKTRCLLKEGKDEYVLSTAYGNRKREHVLTIVDHEVLDTPVGELETIVLKKQRDSDSQRHTLFWIAPALDYMVVKIRHVESPLLYGEIIMRRYSGAINRQSEPSADPEERKANGTGNSEETTQTQ